MRSSSTRPRAGALAQAEALAASAVPRLVYASCEPATFARDAAALVQGGYRLSALEAVDQFLFAAGRRARRRVRARWHLIESASSF